MEIETLNNLKSRQETAEAISGDVEREIVAGVREYGGKCWYIGDDGEERPVRFNVDTPTLSNVPVSAIDYERLKFQTGINVRKGGVIVIGFEAEEEMFTGQTVVQKALNEFDL